MNCPNCQSPLQETIITTKSDQQGSVHECFTCGAHWFPRWLANDITAATANSLDSVVTDHPPTPNPEPRCPQCQARLSPISHDSIPHGVHVFACPEGHGNFFPHHELKRFKLAQEAKITYHELWGIPIRSVFAVLLPVLAVLGITAGIPLTLRQIQNSQENRTQASDIITTPLITPISTGSAVLSFNSKSPSRSTLKLYQDGQLFLTREISKEAVTHHQITLNNLLPNVSYTFTLTLIDSSAFPTTTKPYPLTLTP